MAPALRTPLCRVLGIEYPIFSVGFGFSAGPELVSAVSGAGGCGVLGGSGLPAEEICRRVGRVREVTGRPFGVNVIILEQPNSSDEDRAFVLEEVAAAIEERAPVLVLCWGDPAPFVEEAHRNGVHVFVQVGSVTEAEAAAAAGVDAVIVQGIPKASRSGPASSPATRRGFTRRTSNASWTAAPRTPSRPWGDYL